METAKLKSLTVKELSALADKLDINLEKWIKEGAELADQLELTKLKIKHETYLKNKKEE